MAGNLGHTDHSFPAPIVRRMEIRYFFDRHQLNEKTVAKRRKLSTADRKRVEKLATLADDLRAGEHYPITRLTPIKSLCKEHEVACEFTTWLASLAANKIAGQKRAAYIARPKWNEIKKLAEDGFAVLQRRTSNTRLRNVFEQVQSAQYEFERQHWAMVRIIHSIDLLQIERALECRLDRFGAPQIAYKAARWHAERYDSRFGTGLVPRSAAAVRQIVDFFCGVPEFGDG